MSAKKRITFFLDALHGGGAEKAVVNLLKELSKHDDFVLDLVLAKLEGPYLDQVPKQVRLINLNTGRVITAILPLAKYLKQNRPWAVIGNMGHVNVVAIIAKQLAGIETRLILVEQNTLSVNKSNLLRAKFVPPLMKLLYPRANVVAGVSMGVARDLEKRLGFAKETVRVLNNPIVNEDLIERSHCNPDHPWLQPEMPPVFLAVGRLTEQKDFGTLIEAFALVRQQRPARLMILGEGELRPSLENAIVSLELNEDVALPGFVNNPYGYMSQAAAFVLSSLWEGLPTVLIEAMACGCPVIATNCPSGPDEILAGGEYGKIVPMQDKQALSQAMLETLALPPSRELLTQRANCYSSESVVAQYLSLLHSL
jgi:glycosyltransferase involved in cell wall biosynthesis